MTGRIVDVSSEGIHLSVKRGFLKVSQGGEEVGQVALDDIDAVVVHGHGATWSANLVARLAERGAPVVFCATNHAPVALLWPIDGHYEQGLRMDAQATRSRPTAKRLWRDIVRAKVTAQGDALEAAGENPAALRLLVRRVRSGDPDNIEAQAAQRYWPVMMGADFRRDRSAGGVNALLNYGYIVLRAATARAIIAAGLHPSLAIHHKSRGTALRLADDLMEPFRPFVDLIARRLCDEAGGDPGDLDADAKAALAAVTRLDLQGPKGASPVQACLDRLAQSLARVYLGEGTALELPGPPLPLSSVSN